MTAPGAAATARRASVAGPSAPDVPRRPPVRAGRRTAQFNDTTGNPLMKSYLCIVCGFVYDEAIGLPDDGFPAGTQWADIPADWQCPDCGVAKADFEMVEI